MCSWGCWRFDGGMLVWFLGWLLCLLSFPVPAAPVPSDCRHAVGIDFDLLNGRMVRVLFVWFGAFGFLVC